MAKFLSPHVIKGAIGRLSASRLRRGRLFDFLIVKRTFAIAGNQTVPISESEQAFVQALHELGDIGEVDGRPIQPDFRYLNPFSTRDGNAGYRASRYVSNGTNTTIAGSSWRYVISLTDDKPRRAAFASNYVDALPNLILTGEKAKPLPHVADVAIWYFRNKDVGGVIDPSKADSDNLRELSARFEAAVGLSKPELEAIFDSDLPPLTADPLFQDAEPSPLEYLPHFEQPEEAGPGANPKSVDIIPSVSSYFCPVDLLAAMAAKGFVILSGPSGTGKSRAVLLLADYLQQHFSASYRGRVYSLVAVGPDWTSPKSLLGYKFPFGSERIRKDGTTTHDSFETTDVLRLILRAHHPEAEGIPHILILDEMNLSHVERYFAPFLSLGEAGQILGQAGRLSLVDQASLETLRETLAAENDASLESESLTSMLADGRTLTIPPNLFIVGTVNVDETTYMFSPKVLDRAHVLELAAARPSECIAIAHESASNVSFDASLVILQKGIAERELGSSQPVEQTFSDIAALGVDAAVVASLRETVLRTLDGCFDLLSPVGFAFGFRVTKEVLAYLRTWAAISFARAGSAPSEEWWIEGLDRAVFQKVLPKLHGNRRTLGGSLPALAAYLSGGHASSNPAASYTLGGGSLISIQEADALTFNGHPVILPLSVRKLTQMHERLLSTGYTSFVS